MTREEFDKLYLGKAVHCDTEEKANEFLALADSVGYKWYSGCGLTGRNFWEDYEKETYYHITNKGILFGNIKFLHRLDGYQIIEYQLPYKEETIDDIIEEIEYHQKAINVLHNRLKRKAKVENKMKKIKTLHNEVIKLRNRLSNDGSGEVFEEDHLLLDSVLDLIEEEMKKEVLSIKLNDDTTSEIEN